MDSEHIDDTYGGRQKHRQKVDQIWKFNWATADFKVLLFSSKYWEYALNINMDEIVYVHCHQKKGDRTGGTVVLVGPDGVQRPPIPFPEGDHMGCFLDCVRAGLSPQCQLDPPMWVHREIERELPWVGKCKRKPLPSVKESTEESPVDIVFRVVSKSNQEEFRKF